MHHARHLITTELQASQEAVARLAASPALLAAIEGAADAIIGAYRKGGKVLLAGNGGSAADAQHIAAELVSRFQFDRAPLPALALTTDTAILTAIGNDYAFSELFARQVRAQGKPGDVFIGITTSGRSENILRSLATAQELGLVTIALCGEPGLAQGITCDHTLASPSPVTARIQECHIIIAHVLCLLVEQTLFGKGS